MAKPGSVLGHVVLRVEDSGVLRGETSYVEDFAVPGALHLVFVRASVAHARLNSIDTSGAEAMAGVRAVYTSETLGLMPMARTPAPIVLPPAFARPPLASGTVRFVGDIVAAVLAATRAQAVDAAEMVVVHYDPLPAVLDPEAALEDDAAVLFTDHGSNVAYEFPSLGGSSEASALEEAEVVVGGRFVNQRLAAVPIEPNGVLVEPGDDGSLKVTVPTQMPFYIRAALAEHLGMEPASIRVLAPAVGGAFGAKIVLYPEYLIAAAAARRLNLPVKWTETRSENLVAMTQARAQVQHVAMGLKRDGTITGVSCRAIQDVGAYPGAGAFMPAYTGLMAQGVYVIPRLHFSAVSVATNTTPVSAYRGAGRPEATAFLERLIDMAAGELGIDPVEIRRRNFIPPESFPLTTLTGANYDVANFAGALDEACCVAGYDQLRVEQRDRRERGDVGQLGIGVCVYIEVTAGSGRVEEFGRVEVQPDGTVLATVGTSDQGQGHRTTYAMIVSELLGIPIGRIRVIQSDTALVSRGHGTVASRSMQIGGSALHRASQEVLEQAKDLAGRLLEARLDDIVAHGDGKVGVAGVPIRALPWAELAQIAADSARRPEGWDGALAASVDFNQGDATYPFGAHIAVVEVDTETGQVLLLRHIAVDDCGRVLNPLLVEGQVHGGIAQGVAQALYEGIAYDDAGNPLTATLVDYAVPSAVELPSFELGELVTPTPRNPLGAKGIGESGTMGSTPAVQNAVIDALSHFGIRHLDMPLTPERVWRAIQATREAASVISDA
jgi:aerobic carbon-monoxide dehydrogenase large subunit